MGGANVTVYPLLLQSLYPPQVEEWKVWLTVAAEFAATEERVDTQSRDKTTPCWTGVEYVCDDDWPRRQYIGRR